MIKKFDISLKKIVKPKLELLGFKYNGSRKFVRKKENEKDEIIQFQLGVPGNDKT